MFCCIPSVNISSGPLNLICIFPCSLVCPLTLVFFVRYLIHSHSPCSALLHLLPLAGITLASSPLPSSLFSDSRFGLLHSPCPLFPYFWRRYVCYVALNSSCPAPLSSFSLFSFSTQLSFRGCFPFLPSSITSSYHPLCVSWTFIFSLYCCLNIACIFLFLSYLTHFFYSVVFCHWRKAYLVSICFVCVRQLHGSCLFLLSCVFCSS